MVKCLPGLHILLQWKGLQQTISGSFSCWHTGSCLSSWGCLKSGHLHVWQHLRWGSSTKLLGSITHSESPESPFSTATANLSNWSSLSFFKKSFLRLRSSVLEKHLGSRFSLELLAFASLPASCSRLILAFHRRLARAVRLLRNMNIKQDFPVAHLVANALTVLPKENTLIHRLIQMLMITRPHELLICQQR